MKKPRWGFLDFFIFRNFFLEIEIWSRESLWNIEVFDSESSGGRRDRKVRIKELELDNSFLYEFLLPEHTTLRIQSEK